MSASACTRCMPGVMYATRVVDGRMKPGLHSSLWERSASTVPSTGTPLCWTQFKDVRDDRVHCAAVITRRRPGDNGRFITEEVGTRRVPASESLLSASSSHAGRVSRASLGFQLFISRPFAVLCAGRLSSVRCRCCSIKLCLKLLTLHTVL